MQPRTDTLTLIVAMRRLADDIQSDDGIANAAIAEAADRLEQQRAVLVAAEGFSISKALDRHGSRRDGVCQEWLTLKKQMRAVL